MITISIIVLVLSQVSVFSAQTLSSANNHLFLKLLNHLSDGQNNVFISPFSISNAFAMLYSGAKGETAQEMRQVLGYDLAKLSDQEIKEEFKKAFEGIKDSDKYELDVANKLVVQKGFNISETFKNEAKNVFKSEIESQDFQNEPQEVMDSINQWVSRQTHNKIKSLLKEPLSRSTRLAILNAIYLKAEFKNKFDKYLTLDETFFSADNGDKAVKMMKQIKEFNFTRVPELDSQLLEIPYSGNDISLYILLPNQRQGLRSLKNQLNDFSLIEKHIKSLKTEDIELKLPKFKVETEYSLAEVFSSLGMKSVFTARKADLSGIDGTHDLYVAKVLHKANIKVNEDGTEAAAATGIFPPLPSGFVWQTIPFIVNHPFMFFIRENSNGIVLFGGLINTL